MRKSDKIPIIISEKVFDYLVEINSSDFASGYLTRQHDAQEYIQELADGRSLDLPDNAVFGAVFPTVFAGAVRNTINYLNALAKNNRVKYEFIIDESIIQKHETALGAGKILGRIDISFLQQVSVEKLKEIKKSRKSCFTKYINSGEKEAEHSMW